MNRMISIDKGELGKRMGWGGVGGGVGGGGEMERGVREGDISRGRVMRHTCIRCG